MPANGCTIASYELLQELMRYTSLWPASRFPWLPHTKQVGAKWVTAYGFLNFVLLLSFQQALVVRSLIDTESDNADNAHRAL